MSNPAEPLVYSSDDDDSYELIDMEQDAQSPQKAPASPLETLEELVQSPPDSTGPSEAVPPLPYKTEGAVVLAMGLYRRCGGPSMLLAVLADAAGASDDTKNAPTSVDLLAQKLLKLNSDPSAVASAVEEAMRRLSADKTTKDRIWKVADKDKAGLINLIEKVVATNAPEKKEETMEEQSQEKPEEQAVEEPEEETEVLPNTVADETEVKEDAKQTSCVKLKEPSAPATKEKDTAKTETKKENKLDSPPKREKTDRDFVRRYKQQEEHLMREKEYYSLAWRRFLKLDGALLLVLLHLMFAVSAAPAILIILNLLVIVVVKGVLWMLYKIDQDMEEWRRENLRKMVDSINATGKGTPLPPCELSKREAEGQQPYLAAYSINGIKVENSSLEEIKEKLKACEGETTLIVRSALKKFDPATYAAICCSYDVVSINKSNVLGLSSKECSEMLKAIKGDFEIVVKNIVYK